MLGGRRLCHDNYDDYDYYHGYYNNYYNNNYRRD